MIIRCRLRYEASAVFVNVVRSIVLLPLPAGQAAHQNHVAHGKSYSPCSAGNQLADGGSSRRVASVSTNPNRQARAS
jgi:hypothetical protein